jgi:hypothetical protein
MANPNFTILSDNVLYTNSLTPLEVLALSSTDYSSSYYIWDFGDGTKTTGLSASHIYESVGEYEVTLTQYLSSGEPVTSESQPITAVNLIPNLMDWDDSSFDSDFITASVKASSPFVVNTYNSWQQYDENSFLHLYVENSKSIPFDITDKRIHLKPNWRFLNTEDQVIDTLPLNQTKIYARKESDGEIYIKTIEQDGSIFVGVSSQSEFYFIDDTPSGIDPSVNTPLPSTIIVSQNLSSVYGDDKFTSEDYLQYPSLIKSVTVNNIIPSKLYISSNGVFDIPYLKFQNTKIPFNIRLVDSSGNYIKTNPNESDLVEDYIINIGFIGDVTLSPQSPSLQNNRLERFQLDFSNLGGFYESYFIPSNTTTETVILTAGTLLDYTINKQITKYGIFSDENSNKIYRISYSEGIGGGYSRKNSEVISNVYDGFTSNKFGATIDLSYNSVFLDSDDSRIETYDTSFNLLTSVELTSYETPSFESPLSPAQIQLDQGGNYLITLHDAAKLVYKTENNLQIVDLYSQTYDDSNGTFIYTPAALDILSDNETLYIAYTSELSSFVEKYTITRGVDTISLASIHLEDLSSEITVDMISNRDGDKLYILCVDYTSLNGSIKTYNTSTNSLISSHNVGYNPQYITIDDNQNVWTISQTSSNNTTAILYKLLTTDSIETYNPNSLYGTTFLNIGGIAGDSSGNIWIINSNDDTIYIINTETMSLVSDISIIEDQSITTNNYAAYGDWNGFRWYNKFGYGGSVLTYGLTGQSEPFVIYPKDKFNLQKINEDFNMTETIKSYRTTEAMLNYDNLFDNFLGSIYGNNLDDGTYIGKNIYEKIANFVLNHGDIETCSIDALESFCEETGIEFDGRLNFPRDIKRIVDLFSIKFKKLWGDNYKTGIIENYKGDLLNTTSYVVSADPQVKFIAREKFNDDYTFITPLIVDGLSSYPLSTYEQKWGWGLAVPENQYIGNYYEFYELLPIEDQRFKQIIDWDNELNDEELLPLSSFSNYMTENGIVSTILGDKLRNGLGLYL